ncbi:MAG: lysylphosphatidylglycerol synthase transmembrane domain-containing protein [Aquisalimonadaceae bacterium]
MSPLGRYRGLLLRLGLSTALIVLIVTHIELTRVSEILRAVRPGYLVFALLVIFLERVFMAYKWHLLLAAKNLHVPLMRMLKICYVSSFAGSFMPSSLGADVLRSYCLYKHGTGLAESVSSVLVDKTLSVLVALALPLIVVLLFPDMLPDRAIRWSVLSIALVVFVGAGCLLNRSIVTLGMAVIGKVSRRIAARAMLLHGSVRDYLRCREVVAYVLVLSAGFQLLRVLGVYAIGLSMDPGFVLVYCLIFVPIIVTLAMIPVSVGGIGVREGSFVYLFSQVGMPTSDAFTLAVLVYLVGIVSLLPGGVIYALEGMAAARPRSV